MLVSGYSISCSSPQSSCVKSGVKNYTQTRVEHNAEKKVGDYDVYRGLGSDGTQMRKSYTIGPLEGFYGDENDAFDAMPENIELMSSHYSVNRDGEVCLYQADEKTRICYVLA